MWSFIQQLASPKKFFFLSEKISPWLLVIFIASLAYGLISGLWFAPADYLQGEGFRIIYVHAPCAFLSLFIYSMMATAAVFGLVFRMKMAFMVIRHSALLGACFTFLALVTGSIWGKPMWGAWWIWDARLTSELILLFLYLGILIFQSATKGKRSSEKALAILVLIGFADIPIIHYSVSWWNTLHQGSTVTAFSRATIAPDMLYPLLAMVVAFLAYYGYVLVLRLRYELLAGQANDHWVENR